jgi:signal transduction histidine kinase
MQIRSRLTIQFMMIVAGIMLLAMGYIYVEVQRYLLNEFYKALRSKANLTAAVAIARMEQEGPLESFAFLADGPSFYTENVTIYDHRDMMVYSFDRGARTISPGVMAEIRRNREHTFTSGPYHALGQIFRAASGNEYVVVAEARFERSELFRLLRLMALIFITLLSLVALGGWVFAGQALAPISRIMNQVDALLPSDMSRRLHTVSRRDEIARLVITFNRLLDRLENAFRAQQHFLSNISHELKNPFTVIATQAEIMLQRPRSPEAYQQALRSILEDIRDLNLVTDQLMSLSRIHSGGGDIPSEPLRIDELILSARESLLKARPDYRVQVEITRLPLQEKHLQVHGNEALLRTALVNIMENGCKFSPHHQVSLRLDEAEDQQVILEIRDAGPGIPESEIRQIFDPFFRGQAKTSAKGSGIGLALVHSICSWHQIGLGVENLPSGGTLFRLHFPPLRTETDLSVKS